MQFTNRNPVSENPNECQFDLGLLILKIAWKMFYTHEINKLAKEI